VKVQIFAVVGLEEDGDEDVLFFSLIEAETEEEAVEYIPVGVEVKEVKEVTPCLPLAY
jgi:hypothetical protein